MSLKPTDIATLNDLAQVRTEIDAIDAELLRLLNRRACCAQRVGELKQRETQQQSVYYRPEREAQVLRRLQDANQGPLPDAEVKRLFREIMSICLALEEPLSIAYLGPEGTFTQAAVFKQFGHSVISRECPTITAVFKAVERGQCQYGLVPVENTTEGVVSHTLDCLMQTPLFICGEVQMRIDQYALSHASQLSDIKRVYSHAQSLAQCRLWLAEHLPDAEQLALSSNAEAAKMAAKDPEAIAIAGLMAAQTYHLPILAEHIQDNSHNTTRFLVIGQQQTEASGHDRTSLLVSSPNQPGLLVRLLEPIARYGVDMTRIESRPTKQGMWDYVFFVDLDGHRSEAHMQQLLQEMQSRASLFKILGSYPKSAL